jgi:hypothetical protein
MSNLLEGARIADQGAGVGHYRMIERGLDQSGSSERREQWHIRFSLIIYFVLDMPYRDFKLNCQKSAEICQLSQKISG